MPRSFAKAFAAFLLQWHSSSIAFQAAERSPRLLALFSSPGFTSLSMIRIALSKSGFWISITSSPSVFAFRAILSLLLGFARAPPLAADRRAFVQSVEAGRLTHG